jgi:hypothetical protein
LFAKAALAERKRLAARQSNPEWLEDFLKSAWEPTTAELRKIRVAIAPSDRKWQESYEPIANKVFAHTDRKAAVDELFRGTLLVDIEDILYDLNKIRTAVLQLFENGDKVWIADDDRTYAELFVIDTRNFLNNL